MSLHSKYVGNNLVYYTSHLRRWVDAIGAGVCKVGNDQIQNWTAGDWTVTAVGTSPIAVSNAQGGAITLTTDSSDNDGVQAQYLGELFKLTANDPIYFGCKFAISEKTQSDCVIGLCITDTSAATAVSDGVYFKTVDASAAMTFDTMLNTSATQTAAMTLVDAQEYFVEFYWDGTSVEGFVDGVSLGKVTTTLPTDEELTVTLALLTGANSAEVLTVSYLNCIQVQSDK